MQVLTTYNGSDDDYVAMLERALKPFVERLRELEISAGSAKHLYTIKDVCERTGYGRSVVCRWIHKGTPDRKGKLIYLKHKEITKGDYRIQPADLDQFLSHF
ncbi:helix-turn-helix domain-containing protein [Spirosoma sp. BT702]|uniref:Helix-turn-helix domain-containing protein n=1 Tax=Spirosoma profusum TaxID=2771354 RepID=A0A926XWU6_9BACT|nr:helix-turn-helix domain-containing protein [Spirosoma profusum]MBD2702304.1 helix-turn-helix domain-containing protein [Spirosoma profusum]